MASCVESRSGLTSFISASSGAGVPSEEGAYPVAPVSESVGLPLCDSDVRACPFIVRAS